MKKLLLMPGILACMLTFATGTAYAQAAGLGDAIRNAAGELSAGMAPDVRVAVISMRADSMRMSAHLLDEMIMAFVETQRLLVVNRAQLELVAAELHLGLDGWIDDATAQSIGRLAGVQFIFTGAFEPFGDIYRLRIQAIEVETAIIRRIHVANVRNDAVVSTLLGAAGRTPPREPRRDPNRLRINWLSAEVSYTSGLSWHESFGLGFGLRYERNINEMFSMGVVLLNNPFFDFGGVVTARFFLGDSPFYLEGGLGIGFGYVVFCCYDCSGPLYLRYGSHVSYTGVMLSLGAGVRLGGRTGGFFTNPFISIFPISPGPGGFRVRAGIGAGWAW